jgi:hypothetical protein
MCWREDISKGEGGLLDGREESTEWEVGGNAPLGKGEAGKERGSSLGRVSIGWEVKPCIGALTWEESTCLRVGFDGKGKHLVGGGSILDRRDGALDGRGDGESPR